MITKIGKQKLEEQIKEFEIELKRTCEARGVAAEGGDLKENSSYIFLGERALVLYSQIDQAKADLRQEVVASAPTQTETISFGHQVIVRYEKDNRERTFTLVGKCDAHLKPDWLSCESPLGVALLNKHKLDKINVNDQSIIILDISIGEI